MKSSRLTSWSRAALFAFGMLATAAVGCQSTISGQTMPSAYYISDDVQYHPAGPEDRLIVKRRAAEQFKLNLEKNLGEGDLPAGP